MSPGRPVRRVPDGFRWGAATAAYQIEGAVAEDGRTASIWDTFAHTAGRVHAGDTGDVACDHYHRLDEDLDLMSRLALQDYRFSVSWSRVVPGGRGAPNRAGLDFYARLVDGLLERGIRPVATLYHWDLPQELDDAGGWLNRDTAERFAEYAAVVAEQLGDRMSSFTTLNEPWCSAFLGYASGEHAPGHRDRSSAFLAAYHLLTAHGLGTEVLRSALPDGGDVSVTVNPAVVRAASEADEDVAAAEHVDLIANRLFLEPLMHGRLPAGLVEATADVTDWSFVRTEDLARAGERVDRLGVNYYSSSVVSARPDPEEVTVFPGSADVFVLPSRGRTTAMGWQIDPDAFVGLLVDLARTYPGVPIAITENGAAYPDVATADGSIHDEARADYLVAHVGAVRRAIDAGVDVQAYYVWSLLDNFEWAWGYSQRFGIVHVDFETQQRRIKRSGEVFRRIVLDGGV